MTQLGKLERITEIRGTWPDEAKDFTPWLAENLSLLSEHLGFGPEGLELEAVERFVGPYRADILCRDTTAGNWVLIENQLEKSDHSHLGQLLAYAAGLDCKTIIWVAKSFTPEHKVAVEWLNRNSPNDVSFYALEIELWRINNSVAAPSFNTVVRPSEAARQAEDAKSGLTKGPLTCSKQELFDYWQAFENILSARKSRVSAVSAAPQNWIVHSIGKTGVNLNATWNRAESWLRAEIYLTGAKAQTHFEILKEQRESIEARLGYPLEWYDAAASDRRIHFSKNFQQITDRNTWNEQHNWLADRLDDFYRVFHDIVRALP